MAKNSSVTVRVPATTSNLGPGFDTLGVALALHNNVAVRKFDTGGIQITSPIADSATGSAPRRRHA